MAKTRTTPEAAAESFGVGRLTRHLFVCTGPDCVDAVAGLETWEYVKRRMKELGLAGPDGPAYRTRCACLRICTGGPIAVVYPEGAWYRGVTPENAERILQEHIIGGRVVEELCFARNPLCGASLGTEGDRRIDAGSPPGGNRARDQGHAAE